MGETFGDHMLSILLILDSKIVGYGTMNKPMPIALSTFSNNFRRHLVIALNTRAHSSIAYLELCESVMDGIVNEDADVLRRLAHEGAF